MSYKTRPPSGAPARAFLILEAVHSCALEHPERCGCVVCRAAASEPGALDEILIAAYDERT